MYTYSLQINQHLKLKKIISKAGQIFVFKIHPFIILKKYFWETLIILTHSKEEIKAHHHETLKH